MNKDNCIKEAQRWTNKTNKKYFVINENGHYKIYSEERINQMSNIDKIEWLEVIGI